eukprot:scaffold1959_cov243-Pinguiococcus_pyrenoidosus.AAC.14
MGAQYSAGAVLPCMRSFTNLGMEQVQQRHEAFLAMVECQETPLAVLWITEEQWRSCTRAQRVRSLRQFSLFDSEANRKASALEMFSAVALLSDDLVSAKVAFILSLIDLDGDGRVNQSEVAVILCSAGKGLAAAKAIPPPPVKLTNRIARDLFCSSEDIADDSGELAVADVVRVLLKDSRCQKYLSSLASLRGGSVLRLEKERAELRQELFEIDRLLNRMQLDQDSKEEAEALRQEERGGVSRRFRIQRSDLENLQERHPDFAAQVFAEEGISPDTIEAAASEEALKEARHQSDRSITERRDDANVGGGEDHVDDGDGEGNNNHDNALTELLERRQRHSGLPMWLFRPIHDFMNLYAAAADSVAAAEESMADLNLQELDSDSESCDSIDSASRPSACGRNDDDVHNDDDEDVHNDVDEDVHNDDDDDDELLHERSDLAAQHLRHKAESEGNWRRRAERRLERRVAIERAGRREGIDPRSTGDAVVDLWQNLLSSAFYTDVSLGDGKVRLDVDILHDLLEAMGVVWSDADAQRALRHVRRDARAAAGAAAADLADAVAFSLPKILKTVATPWEDVEARLPGAGGRPAPSGARNKAATRRSGGAASPIQPS